MFFLVNTVIIAIRSKNTVNTVVLGFQGAKNIGIYGVFCSGSVKNMRTHSLQYLTIFQGPQNRKNQMCCNNNNNNNNNNNIPVEVWGERLYPLVVGTFWLGLPPQHYKNHNHPQNDSLQIPRLASIQKGYPSIPWVSKTLHQMIFKNWRAFCSRPILLPNSTFLPHKKEPTLLQFGLTLGCDPNIDLQKQKYKSSTKTISQPRQGVQSGVPTKSWGPNLLD